MPRRRLPTNVLDARGSFQANPQRRKKREAEPEVTEPLGNPPAHLNADQKKVWRELKKDGWWLTAADRHSVEIASVLIAEFRTNPGEMQAARLSNMIRILGHMGMTASERSKVQVKKPEKKDDLDDIL